MRAGPPAWVVMGVGALAGILMIVSEFLLIRYVTTITASCSDLASAAVRDSCSTSGHSQHYWAIGILGLFTILMAFGVAAGRSRPAAFALLAAGVVCLGISLIHDLPDTSSKGQVGSNFADAKAHAGDGFWLELIGGVLAVGTAAFALTQLPALVPDETEVEEGAEEEVPPEEPEREPSEEEPVPAEEPEPAAEEEEAEKPARARRRRRKKEPEPADTGGEEEGAKEEPEAVTEEAATTRDEPEVVAETAEAAAKPKPSERKRKPRQRRAGKPATPKPQKGETPGDIGVDEGSEEEAASTEVAEPAAETTEAVPEHEHDSPAARRAAERRAKRKERAEAARKRQQRPPRERARKKPADKAGEKPPDEEKKPELVEWDVEEED